MAIFLEECREHNITQSQYGCLRVVQEYPGIDQIAAGRLIGLDRSTAGLVIKALSDRGLITRVVNRADKRRMQLELSAKGARLLRAIAPAAARAQERVLSGLPAELRPEFLAMLERFLAGHDAVINVQEVLTTASAGTGRAGRQLTLSGHEPGEP